MIKKVRLIVNTHAVFKKMSPNLIYAFSQSKNYVLEDGFRDSCCEHVVTFAEKYSLRSVLFRKLQYVESQFSWEKRSTKKIFLRTLRNIQYKLTVQIRTFSKSGIAIIC